MPGKVEQHRVLWSRACNQRFERAQNGVALGTEVDQRYRIRRLAFAVFRADDVLGQWIKFESMELRQRLLEPQTVVNRPFEVFEGRFPSGRG